MKKYYYSRQIFFASIIFPVFLMIGLFMWSIYGIWVKGMSPLYQLILITMPILLLFTLIGINNPSSIILTSDSIIFKGFGRQHQYFWSEVKEIHIKDYGYVGKSFIRIGRYRLLGGRYWISNKLHGYKELLSFLQQKIHS
ncbi:hypothetical protein ACQKP0_04185 [Heyndrickxia sp. NPDC080065]|uniref:hypothetical protein n=1 Tax=Heyndrickxia sp. NPDC080065 TaxID=3390568 RepID=UPI003D01627C